MGRELISINLQVGSLFGGGVFVWRGASIILGVWQSVNLVYLQMKDLAPNHLSLLIRCDKPLNVSKHATMHFVL